MWYVACGPEQTHRGGRSAKCSFQVSTVDSGTTLPGTREDARLFREKESQPAYPRGVERQRQRSDVQQQARDRQAHLDEGRREVGVARAEVREAVGRGLRMEPGLVTPSRRERGSRGAALVAAAAALGRRPMRRCFLASG